MWTSVSVKNDFDVAIRPTDTTLYLARLRVVLSSEGSPHLNEGY